MVECQCDLEGKVPIFRKIRACVTFSVLSNGCEFIGGPARAGWKVVGCGLHECLFVNRALDYLFIARDNVKCCSVVYLMSE